jgi:hypothetical protein
MNRKEGDLGYAKARLRLVGAHSGNARLRHEGTRAVYELYGRTSSIPTTAATYLGTFFRLHYLVRQRASSLPNDVYRSDPKINYRMSQRRKSGSLCIIVSIIHSMLQAGWLAVRCLLHAWQKPQPISSYESDPSCAGKQAFDYALYMIPSPVAISARVCCSSFDGPKSRQLIYPAYSCN